MTMDMPRKLPLHVTRDRSRHGKLRFYFRKGKGLRLRLPDLGSPDFEEAYREALAGSQRLKRRTATAGTLQWLIERYRDTGDYRSLSPATRKQRDNIFKGVIAKSGSVKFRAVTKAKVVQGREDRASTPAQARNFLDAMRGLFRWALDADLVSVDPTAGVKNPKRPKSGGFAAWTEEEAAAYEKRWPEGTKERVWFHVLLYTGLRRGDAVRLGRQHICNGVATLETEKTGMEVNVPIAPVLERTLKQGPTGDLIFIVGDRGTPLKKETFGNMFRVACNQAGVRGKSAHGLRKLRAARLAEDGLSERELDSLFGWSGGTMASHYTKTADRKRLARSVADRIRGEKKIGGSGR